MAEQPSTSQPTPQEQSRRDVSNPKWELEISKRLEEEFKARKDLEKRLEEAVRARVALEDLCRRLTEKLREQNNRWDVEVKKMKARILLELSDAKERIELELEETKEKVIEEICQKNDSSDLITRLFAPKKREERAVQREKEKEGNRKREEERKKKDEEKEKRRDKKKPRRKSNSQKRRDEEDSDTGSQRSGKDSDEEDSSSETPREHDIVLLDKFLKDRPTLQKLEERNIIRNYDEANKEKIRVEESIDKFLQHRTPKEVLQKKGILSEYAIFGVPLDELLEGGHIPKFVRKAIECLKTNSLDTKQLFQVQPDPTIVLARRASLESSGDVEFTKSDDPHVVAILLLEFLLELPQPLIPFKSYDQFVEATEIEDGSFLVSIVHSLVFGLPSTSRVVLQFLISFLQSALEKSDSNQLSVEKLASTFGPLIMRPTLDHHAKSVLEFSATVHPHRAQATKIFSNLVSHYSAVFIGEDNDIKYVMKDGHQVVKQGKLDKLVSKLVDELYTARDDDFIDAFLLTYRYFTTPYLLLEKLIGLYTCIFDSKNPSKKWQLNLRLRVLAVIKRWITNYQKDLAGEKDFCDRLCFFVSRTTNITDQESVVFNAYREWIEKLDEPTPVVHEITSTAPVVPLDILSRSASDFCSQLTLIDHAAFKKMKIQELLGKAFLKPDRSPDFTAMVNQFNKWCHWIPTEVLKRETPAQRAEVISKFIQIAKECKHINNFNTCFAIVCGLQNSSISRLKYSWEKVNKKELKVFNKLLDLFSLNKNYKNYRELLTAAHVPLVPYLAVFPKDIFAIEENHPNINDDGTVNFTKFRLLWQILKKVLSYQTSEYPLKPDPELRASLRGIHVISEEEQFQRSLIVEPKESN